MATSNTPKNADTAIPILKDQGMPNVCGAYAKGLSMQVSRLWKMVSGGVFDFTDNGLSDMADTDYLVFIQNHTDAADEGTCLANVRLANQITITGPDDDDLLDILIVGRLAGQLGD